MSRAAAACALLAVLCWAAALLLPGARRAAAPEHWLVDVSASLGPDFDEAAFVADPRTPDAAGFAAARAEGRVRFFARSVATLPTEAGVEESALGRALAATLGDLGAGARLRVWTDGRATDPLPLALAPGPVVVEAVFAPPRPRLVDLAAPAAWPADGRVRVRFRIVGTASGAGGGLVVGSAGLPVELTGLRPLGGGRYEAELRAPRPAEGPTTLRLEWVADDGSRAVRTLALRPHHDAAAPPRVSARDLGATDLAFLRAGGVLIAAAPRLGDWLAAPAALRAFRAASEAPPLVVLLDRSGSMDGGPLDTARTFLEAAAAAWPADAPFLVRPFADVVEAPFDPRTPGGRARLHALAAFGPTRPDRALAEVLEATGDEVALLLVSDGRFPEAPGPELRARLGGRRIWCVAVGPDADRDALAAVGELVAGDDLGDRLAAALGAVAGRGSGPGRALPGVSLPVPDPLPLVGRRDRMRAAAGAETLAVDGGGGAVLVALRVGAGLLLAVAASVDRFDPELLAATVAAFERGDGGGWGRDGAFLRSAEPPVLVQGGRRVGPRLRDPGPPATWDAPSAARGRPLRVGEGAAAWVLPPDPAREWTASDAAARRLFASAGAAAGTAASPDATLLQWALGLATLSFLLSSFLAPRSRS